jgi:hypothetical protein
MSAPQGTPRPTGMPEWLKGISNGKWRTANFKWAEVLLRKKPLCQANLNWKSATIVGLFQENRPPICHLNFAICHLKCPSAFPASRPSDDMQKCTYVVNFATLSSLVPWRSIRNLLIPRDKE